MMMMRNKVTTMTSSSSRKSFRSENRGGRALRTLFVCALFAWTFASLTHMRVCERRLDIDGHKVDLLLIVLTNNSCSPS